MGSQFLVQSQMVNQEILPLLSALKYLSDAIEFERLDAKVEDLSLKVDTAQMMEEYELESSEEESEEEEEESDTDSIQSAPATFSFKVQRTQ